MSGWTAPHVATFGRSCSPEELPLHPEVTVDLLAAEYGGTAGGDIVNVTMAAAAAAVARQGDRRRVVELGDLRCELAATMPCSERGGHRPCE